METRRDSEFFREPVAWKELGLLDYPTVIPRPMDLSTVQSILNGSNPSASEYKDIHQAINDVRLIFKNALTYNRPEARASQHARSLGTFFEEQLRLIDPSLSSALHRAFLAAEAPMAKPARDKERERPTAEVLQGLADSFQRLSSEEVQAALELLLVVSPAAVTASGPGRGAGGEVVLQVALEALNDRACRKLQQFMCEAFLENSSNKKNKKSKEKKAAERPPEREEAPKEEEEEEEEGEEKEKEEEGEKEEEEKMEEGEEEEEAVPGHQGDGIGIGIPENPGGVETSDREKEERDQGREKERDQRPLPARDDRERDRDSRDRNSRDRERGQDRRDSRDRDHRNWPRDRDHRDRNDSRDWNRDGRDWDRNRDHRNNWDSDRDRGRDRQQWR